MFDNVPSSDQFHQFIASSRPSSPLPFPFPFPLHAAAAPPPPPPPPPPAFPSYDPYPPHHQTLHHLLLPPPPPPSKSDGSAKEFHRLASERERLTAGPEPARPWSNDEVLALLKIRSSMEIWFPDFTWEHVSRKLAEVGYKRSAEKCKERFEEESRNLSFNKSLRFFTELDDDDDGDELYHHQHTDHHHHHHHHQNPHYNHLSSHHHHNNNLTHDDDHDHEEDPPIPVRHGEEEDNMNSSHSRSLEEGEEIVVDHSNMSNTIKNEEVTFVTRRESTKNATTSSNDNDNGNNSNYNNDDNDDNGHDENDDGEEDERMKKKKNMKRKERFEMFKGMCERIVERIMGQQEELHNKIIEDMVKLEEVKIARDDARKREEMDRMNREIEIREKEQVIASDRHAKMIEFLNKLSSSSSSSSSSTSHSICCTGKFHDDLFDAMTYAPNSCEKKGFPSPSPLIPLPTTTVIDHDDDQTMIDAGPTPSSPEQKKSRPSRDGGVGKRWPREEVLALINLRSSVNNNGSNSDESNNSNNNNDPKDGAKGPLWERISQGMQELGYSRSAKRCKEKWENINKYFRKTKDSKKKRPLDSRTCPYFHQLSTLYCGGGGGGGRGDLREASPEAALEG